MFDIADLEYSQVYAVIQNSDGTFLFHMHRI